MLGYYFGLAWRSLGRSPGLTALMVLAIGLGIGASMTMITVLHVMSGDPLPGISAQLFVPMLDPRDADHAAARNDGRAVPDGFTWTDVTNLLRAHRADAQAAMASGYAAIRPASPGVHPYFADGQYVTSEFFRMFAAPFEAGTGWNAAQDRDRARVVVLNTGLARKLFGSADALGRTVKLNDTAFRVIGVLRDWHPQPAFYKQKGDRIYGDADGFFIPLQTALATKFGINGHTSCWGDGDGGDRLQSDHCTWAQFWVRLDTSAKVAAYRRFLADY